MTSGPATDPHYVPVPVELWPEVLAAQLQQPAEQYRPGDTVPLTAWEPCTGCGERVVIGSPLGTDYVETLDVVQLYVADTPDRGPILSSTVRTHTCRQDGATPCP